MLPVPSPPWTTRIGLRFAANSFSARRSNFFFSRRFFRASGLRSNHWQRGHVSTLCAGFLRLQRRGVRPVVLTTMTLSDGSQGCRTKGPIKHVSDIHKRAAAVDHAVNQQDPQYGPEEGIIATRWWAHPVSASPSAQQAKW